MTIQFSTPRARRISWTASATFASWRNARPRRRELQTQLRQFDQGSFDLLMTRMGILFGFARAVVPNQSVSFDAQRGRLGDGVLVHDLAVVISLVMDVPPLDLATAEQVPEGTVLGSSPGQHGEEPALVLMDMGHVLGAGQLAVRDVEEISSSGQATEKVPGSTMSLV